MTWRLRVSCFSSLLGSLSPKLLRAGQLSAPAGTKSQDFFSSSTNHVTTTCQIAFLSISILVFLSISSSDRTRMPWTSPMADMVFAQHSCASTLCLYHCWRLPSRCAHRGMPCATFIPSRGCSTGEVLTSCHGLA